MRIPKIPKISIVILTYNSIQDLPRCLNSIKEKTKVSYEIIVVDNNSTDGTREYLQNAQLEIQIILNSENVGFASGCNIGIKAATGEYVVLLNPDTVVTKDWLKRMLVHFKHGVGAVGPISNFVGGYQSFPHHYAKTDLGEINPDSFATKIYKQNKGKSLATKLLIGFCLMVKRETIEKIGVLDEDFFFGNEDLEYSLRLRLNGYTLAIATDVFIYHKPGELRSIESMRISNESSQKSQIVLKSKLENIYGKGKIPSAMELFDCEWPFSSKETRQEATLGVVIIAKNEEAILGNLLGDLQHEIIDEIVVIDTGSTDKTVQIAKAYGAKVRRFKWSGSFADARNKANREAQSDYLIWLDADDRMFPEALRSLTNLKPQLSTNKDMAVMLKLVNRFEDKAPSSAWQMRLFPNRADIKWEGKIHEQLTKSMVTAGLRVHKANIAIEHFGYYTIEDRKRKAIRNFKILIKAMNNGDGSSSDYYNLAASYLQLEDYENCLKNAKACQAKGDSEWARYSIQLIADCYCHRMTKENGKDLAIEEVKKGLKTYKDDSVLLYLLGTIYQEKGDNDQALKYYNKVEQTGVSSDTYPIPIDIPDRIRRFKEEQCQRLHKP